MSRNPFGWNLPPGVTDQMIDDAFGGEDDPCECDELEHRRKLALMHEQGFSQRMAAHRAAAERADLRVECESCVSRRRAEYARDEDAEYTNREDD